jgi:hypothetical protein
MQSSTGGVTDGAATFVLAVFACPADAAIGNAVSTFW